MSYRELSMIDVKEVLRRWAAGHSNRKIARETGTDRGTATRYIAVAEQLALPRDRERRLPADHRHRGREGPRRRGRGRHHSRRAA